MPDLSFESCVTDADDNPQVLQVGYRLFNRGLGVRLQSQPSPVLVDPSHHCFDMNPSEPLHWPSFRFVIEIPNDLARDAIKVIRPATGFPRLGFHSRTKALFEFQLRRLSTPHCHHRQSLPVIHAARYFPSDLSTKRKSVARRK